MNVFLILLIAISLSMDAFSLSLAYGTLGINKKDKILISTITGIFHFFMPLFGFLIGNIIMRFIKLNSNIIVATILLFIGIEMIISSLKKEKEIKIMKVTEFFLFALAVSIDSFSVGITLTDFTKNVIFGPLTFAFTSFVFTYLGLSLGNKIEKLLGKISTLIGGTILSIIGLCYVL